MVKSEQLKKQRCDALDAAKAVLAKARAENREISDEEAEVVKAKYDEGQSLVDPITAAQEREAMIADVNQSHADLDKSEQPRTMALGTPNTTTSDVNAKKMIRVEGGRLVAEDDPKCGFKFDGEFIQAVHNADSPNFHGDTDKRLHIGAAATGMGQTTGADGGWAVPPAFSTAIWDEMNDGVDDVFARTDTFTITGESMTFLANAETSRATGSRWGGARGYWINEADQITASKPTLRRVKIEPHQVAALIYMTDKLLSNNQAGLAQYVGRAASAELSFLISDSIINGDGSGKPKGLLKSLSSDSTGPVISVTAETGQVAATLLHENITKMWSRMHLKARRNAVWFINQDVEPQLNTMTLGVGTSAIVTYLPPGGLSSAPYGTLMGRPVIPIEYCATLGTQGDVILADMSAYLSGTQGGLQSAMSMHLRFDYAETAFRWMTAVDGQPWMAAPITPFKGTNTTSPFVVLDTRA